MNLNLISPSGSQKNHSDVTQVDKSGHDAITDPSSEGNSDSFLSKLAALFGGNSSENSGEEQAVTADADSSAVRGLQHEADDVEGGSESQLAANTGEAGVDELLETGKVTETDDAELISDVDLNQQEKQAAEQVVGEGQEVLSRLKTASQQLIQKDGKELPASEADKESKHMITSDISDDPQIVSPELIQNQQIVKSSPESDVAKQSESTDENLLTSVSGERAAGQVVQTQALVTDSDGQRILQADTLVSEAEKLKAGNKDQVNSALLQSSNASHKSQPLNQPSQAVAAHMLTQQGSNQTTDAAILQQGAMAGQELSTLQTQIQQNNVSASNQAGANFSKQWTDRQALNALSEKKNSVAPGAFAGSHGESVAQHLSSVTGQMGQLRAEQVQNQSPVYINKDIAADQLSERIHMMMSKNLKNIDIRLDPPELGRMHIRMHMAGDQATVHFTVANNQARDVIEHSMGRLRDMLTQQGVQLGETSVQHQGANQQQGYAAHDQSAEHASSQFKDSGFAEDNPDTGVKLDLNVTEKRDGISYYA
ncbi:flagellar hook-length control protein FliK [Vibrio quintilis]|uniref:Flagellar hook-length control protein FliK n=1 Tax=Vibrio quintilis TaxID=1117707 RepID=A0A1M7YT97_9VIBR|nr:flagellar hook-length control protein FliK [Vibrio quintilis]SHO55860.1 Flagellar hook-length control protein FliK [Vibrio quintilis]